MTPSRHPKIVVIGGGTGSFVVLSGLKHYTPNITAIVSMSDDGGSTGILRDELGVLPPGDVRQCLVALSDSGQLMRDLFNYRFEEGTLGGHSFGNLFLTALEKTMGSFGQAVKTASEVLKITGRVVPVTLTDNKLVLTHPGGHTTVGQYAVETAQFEANHPELSLDPPAILNPEAKIAIAEADVVVIAPGNLYASLAPALIVQGMGEALRRTEARLVYICNLVTKPGQTDGFKVHDYAAEIERFIGGPVLDFVIYNRRKPTPELLKKYARDGEYAVGIDRAALRAAHYDSLDSPLISDTMPILTPAEQNIPRTFIRHDSDKIARLIMKIARKIPASA
jgi:uncharacterized cofD-like protein